VPKNASGGTDASAPLGDLAAPREMTDIKREFVAIRQVFERAARIAPRHASGECACRFRRGAPCAFAKRPIHEIRSLSSAPAGTRFISESLSTFQEVMKPDPPSSLRATPESLKLSVGSKSMANRIVFAHVIDPYYFLGGLALGSSSPLGHTLRRYPYTPHELF